jgi:hypothetical protein
MYQSCKAQSTTRREASPLRIGQGFGWTSPGTGHLIVRMAAASRLLQNNKSLFSHFRVHDSCYNSKASFLLEKHTSDPTKVYAFSHVPFVKERERAKHNERSFYQQRQRQQSRIVCPQAIFGKSEWSTRGRHFHQTNPVE